MNDCVFCKIIAGEIPTQFVYRDDYVVAFADVNPQAPKHLLVLPVKHVENVAAMAAVEPPELMAKLFSIAAKLGNDGSSGGFRLVVNTGGDSGQTVPHLHVHVLAGRRMEWHPG